MMSEHWPRGTLVTRLYEGDSLALSLIRLSGETRAHRSPSARPAFLTVRRLLYSNGFLPPFSSAEFCSAYQTPARISAEDAELARSFDEDDMAQGLCGLREIGPKSCTVSGGARYVVNVGSVGLPREGQCGTYCTYDIQSGRLQFVFLEK